VHPRLYLITPEDLDIDRFPDQLAAALAGGDVACLMIADGGWGETGFQKIAERIVPMAQKAGTAVLVHNDSRTAGRSRADGIHVDTGTDDLKQALETFRPGGIVGVGDIRTRHDAMTAAELGVDYVFFGLLAREEDEEPHRKTLDFASWWAEMFETPCVALSGHALAGIETAAATGADFVAARAAIWNHPDGPEAAVRAANEILSRHQLGEVDNG
jgi:thiamine-phosphate pyrophosphorylase